jgi:hypothetical protein
MTENPEPVQPAQTQQPTQSVEDTMKRLAGVPKTADELEAEREAIEEEREGRFAESRQPAPGTQTTSPNDSEPIPQPGPTPPEPEPEPDPLDEPETPTTP